MAKKAYKSRWGLLQVPVEELRPGMVIDVWWLAGRDFRERVVQNLGDLSHGRLGTAFQAVMMADGQELKDYTGRRFTVGHLIPVWQENTETARQGLELVRKLRIEP